MVVAVERRYCLAAFTLRDEFLSFTMDNLHSATARPSKHWAYVVVVPAERSKSALRQLIVRLHRWVSLVRSWGMYPDPTTPGLNRLPLTSAEVPSLAKTTGFVTSHPVRRTARPDYTRPIPRSTLVRARSLDTPERPDTGPKQWAKHQLCQILRIRLVEPTGIDATLVVTHRSKRYQFIT